MTIRCGVVGVGHLGYHHARNYASLDGAQLVGVVETDRDRGLKAAHDFNTTWFATIEELLSAGVDAVSVVVPTTLHHGVSLQLLESGIDVLVEKPIAADVSAAEAMVRAASSRGRLLQVGHIERFNGAVAALFDALKSPRFIECHRLSPYPNRGDDVSVVLDLMIHDLEIVMALVASPLVTVDAMGVSVFSKYEDIANARLRFASGCVANITCSRVSLERMRKIRVFTDSAYVSTDYSAQEVLLYRKKAGDLAPGANPMELIEVEALPVQREEPLKQELASFIECVRTRKRPLVSGEDALEALRLAQRVVQDIREHG